MGGLSLGNPAALLLLIAIVPLVAAGRHAARRRRSADAAYGGSAARRHGASGTRQTAQLALLVGAVILSTVAVAQPRWGSEERAVPRVGIDVVIALDISRSMTATDVEPSRAGAAADGLRRMLTHLRGDRVGLVVFAGSAYARAPLTLDLDAVRQLVTRSQAEAAERIDWPADLDVTIVWTGTPARTSDLVAKVKQLEVDAPDRYRGAMDVLSSAAAELLDAIETSDAERAVRAADAHGRAMGALGDAADAPIMTDDLERIAELARACGGGAKPSGAGGGDVALAFFSSAKASNRFREACSSAGLTLLSFTLGAAGVRLEEM